MKRSALKSKDDAAAARVRKNMDMDPTKLTRAQAILGARTETETVDQALDYVIFQSRVFAALEGLAATGGVDDVFGDTSLGRPKRVAERPRR